jgi:hypothetical protein
MTTSLPDAMQGSYASAQVQYLPASRQFHLPNPTTHSLRNLPLRLSPTLNPARQCLGLLAPRTPSLANRIDRPRIHGTD